MPDTPVSNNISRGTVNNLDVEVERLMKEKEALERRLRHQRNRHGTGSRIHRRRRTNRYERKGNR